VPRNVLELLIKYHFLDSAKRAAELAGRPVETSGNESLTLNSADVDQADIELSNGYLHVVNKVFLPPSLSTLTGLVFLDQDKDLSMFAAAVKASAFDDDLAMMDPKYTVFAPTNAAFTASGIDVTTASAADLEKIVRYHVVDSTVIMGPNLNGTYNTMSDKPITISGTTITGVVNPATIIQMDKTAANGVLHKINAVLKPE
jgi:transforming growth factor-beta-induced protein